ncbi:MAG: hypothetical protein F6K18_13965 [Okeania sp. SIO2C2]|uniref:hypothetical protein n=1 Tax=Okeania sp. SIO2C2 TaxID=2607787 RepID=UPI0013B77A54|nr:hypothetical protein [Okeania sp. SIO2C2]NEP87834.1 hypothetical protein [Okeania sp. SIO2C2]
MESSSYKDEDLRLARRFIESLRQDEEGQALLEQLQSSTSTDASIDQALRNRLQTDFSTEISGGTVDNIVNIAKANVVQFLPPKPEPKKVEPHNIPPSDVEFIGRELELETLHQQLKQKGRVVVYSEENSPGKTELARQYALLAWEKQIYPGGICWLQGQKANLGQQIVNFAKSRLGLQPPEDRDLQSQIDYCWSDWLEGDVLVVLDDIRDYQQVKSYLPSRSEQNFKLLITTSQPSLEQSFLDEGFEPLFLSRTVEELTKFFSYDSNEANFPYILLITIIFFVICSGLSLIMSYILADSKPWLTRYTDYGGIIEFIRTVIFSLTEIYIVFIVFRQEFNEFFGFENTIPAEYRKARNFIRIIMLAIAVAVIIIVPYYHLEYAPQKLADFWEYWTKKHPEDIYIELDSKEGYDAYKRPYLYYLPYSLINYIIVGLLMIFVTIYASIKDSIFLKIYQTKIRDKQIKISLLKQHYFGFFDTSSICKKVALNFTYFSHIFVNKLGNYTSVFLCINIGIAFEVTVGIKTLAPAAILWLVLSYFVWTVGLLIVFLTYRYYEKSLQESGNLLLEMDCHNLEEFQDKNSVIMLLKTTFNNYSNLYLGLLLTAIIFIWAFVKNIMSG